MACTFKHFITTTAKKETIWHIWSKVDDWHLWDDELKAAHIKGPFTKGAHGTITLLNGKTVPFTLTECTHLKSFTAQSKLPLCTMNFVHEVHDFNGGTKIVHYVQFSGILSFIFCKILGKKMDKNIPLALENLVKRAEQH